MMTKTLGLLALLASLCGTAERSVYAKTPPSAMVRYISDRYARGASVDFGLTSTLIKLGKGWEIRSLLRGGVLPVGKADEAGDTLLHLAISRGRADILRLLILGGADVNAVNDAGWTPLHLALSFVRDDLAKLLVRNGADVNVATAVYGWTPLHIAAALHGAEMVSFLLEHGAFIGARSRVGGFTPLAVTDWRGKGCLGLEVNDPVEVVAAALGVKEGDALVGADVSVMVETTVALGGTTHDLPINKLIACMQRPSVIYGNFTAAGATERLAFVNVDIELDAGSEENSMVGYFGGRLVVLIDKDQISRLIYAADHSVWVKRFCLDPVTKTHSVVLRRAYQGIAVPDETVYLHYDLNGGALARVFSEEAIDDEWHGLLQGAYEPWRRESWNQCTWREKKAAILVSRKAAGALQLNQQDSFAGERPSSFRGVPAAIGGEIDIDGEETSALPKVGEPFRDCDVCPKMVVVPSGSYSMGSVRRVSLRPFAVGVYEVTFAEWDTCVAGGGCGGYRPWDRNWGRGGRPVVNVNWNDAQLYVDWLSDRTGQKYRLLSESEWEYAARAGTTGLFHTGGTISTDQANYTPYVLYEDSPWNYRGRTLLVGSFPANGFGLHDLHGNVAEWVQDCWKFWNCSKRVLRGGSWSNNDWALARRSWGDTDYFEDDVGFRVARTLTP